MTNMYDKPKQFSGHLSPYPAYETEENGNVLGLDPLAKLQEIEQSSRERHVAIETVRLLRQRVIHCYRKEGVNHYENCQTQAKELFDVINAKHQGQIQPPNSRTLER